MSNILSACCQERQDWDMEVGCDPELGVSSVDLHVQRKSKAMKGLHRAPNVGLIEDFKFRVHVRVLATN